MDTSPQLMLAVDRYNRYPGELVTLFVRFTPPERPGTTLQLAMPRVMQPEAYRLPPGAPPNLPSVAEVAQELIVLIPLEGYFPPGISAEIQIDLRLNTFYADQYLDVEARLTTPQGDTLDQAALRVTVLGKGKYLQHLPEIYADDDFASRFLMLFESFWKPVGQQIDQVDLYFDPDLTPPAFVPWLASWLGMPVDPFLPLERVRLLLKHALVLFQRRGTRQALKTYLEIYTAGESKITERRAANLVLGSKAVLGMDVALGKENRTNLVEIQLSIPQAELERSAYTPEVYRRKIIEQVRLFIPAHVSFEVSCEFVSGQP